MSQISSANFRELAGGYCGLAGGISVTATRPCPNVQIVAVPSFGHPPFNTFWVKKGFLFCYFASKLVLRFAWPMIGRQRTLPETNSPARP